MSRKRSEAIRKEERSRKVGDQWGGGGDGKEKDSNRGTVFLRKREGEKRTSGRTAANKGKRGDGSP